ncbi:MAG: rhodanese-like domain-containing protein, partial [Bacteroidota bacterium]
MKHLHNWLPFLLLAGMLTLAGPSHEQQTTPTVSPPPPLPPPKPSIANSNIDYDSFVRLTSEIAPYRQERLVDVETFMAMAEDENTIILDTRSKNAFDQLHWGGAIHLNFSDFTADKLAVTIPSQETRILIYCNNNFLRGPEAFAPKSMPLALNIPTF